MKEIIRNTFLFSGLDSGTFDEAISRSSPKIMSFKRGELIYPTSISGLDVGVVIEGKCEIRRPRSDGQKTILNILSEGDSFGILSVFSADEFPTQVFASKNTTVLFFSKEETLYFVNNYSQISRNVITFFANRVSFLNKKIATFSGKNVEKRLSAFLLCEAKRYNSDHFPFNALKTAEEINSGRASVYRAIEALESQGIISINKKRICLIDLEGLERISK